MAIVWSLDLEYDLKYLLVCLADFGDDDGENIFPTVARIAWKIGCKERKVQNGLHELRERGFIELVAAAIRYRPAEYRLTIDGKARLRPFKPRGAKNAPLNGARGARPSTPGVHDEVGQGCTVERAFLSTQESTQELDPSLEPSSGRRPPEGPSAEGPTATPRAPAPEGLAQRGGPVGRLLARYWALEGVKRNPARDAGFMGAIYRRCGGNDAAVDRILKFIDENEPLLIAADAPLLIINKRCQVNGNGDGSHERLRNRAEEIAERRRQREAGWAGSPSGSSPQSAP